MPTPTKGPRLGGSPAHERLIMANLAQSLFEHGRITTTQAKAKRLRPYAERLITKAKRGDLHNRREVLKVIRNKDVLHKLFAEIGPFFADRDGGYTRIVKTLPRKGDNAPMAVIELVQEKTVTREAEAARNTKFASDTKETAAPAPAEEVTETVAEDTATEDTATEDTATEDTATEDTATEDTATEDTATEDTANEDTATEDTAADVEASASTDEAPFGEGSHAALDDGSQPEGFPIKGNADSKLYHVPDSPFYSQTNAEVWFATAEDAEKAGFSLPPSQQESADEDES